MKRKVRVSKPCFECGGNVSHLEYGGTDTEQGMNEFAQHEVDESAEEEGEEQSAVGRCTGTNFGGPECPKGSDVYNLALKYRRNPLLLPKREGNGVAEQNRTIDITTGGLVGSFQDFLAANATNVVREEEAIRAASQPMHQMPDGSMMPGEQHMQEEAMARYGGHPRMVVGGDPPVDLTQMFETIPAVELNTTPTDAPQPQFQGPGSTKVFDHKETNKVQWGQALKPALSMGMSKLGERDRGRGRGTDYEKLLTDGDLTSADKTATVMQGDRGDIAFNDFGLNSDPNDYTTVQWNGVNREKSQYGGTPSYEPGGQFDINKNSPYLNDKIDIVMANRDSNQGIIDALGAGISDTNLRRKHVVKTKLNKDFKKDFKKPLKAYNKAYKESMDNSKFNFDFYNPQPLDKPLEARDGLAVNGQHPLPKARWGWWDDIWGIDKSMERKRASQASTPRASVGRHNYFNNKSTIVTPEMLAREAAAREAKMAEDESQRRFAEERRVAIEEAEAEADRIAEEATSVDDVEKRTSESSSQRRRRKAKEAAAEKATTEEELAATEKQAVEESVNENGNVQLDYDDKGKATNNSGNRGNDYRGGHMIYPSNGGPPIPVSRTQMSKINYRNNPFRRKGHQRVKSIEYGSYIDPARGYAPSAEEMAALKYLPKFSSNGNPAAGNSSDPNDPANMLTDGTYDNMNTPDFGDGPDMEPFDPNGDRDASMAAQETEEQEIRAQEIEAQENRARYRQENEDELEQLADGLKYGGKPAFNFGGQNRSIWEQSQQYREGGWPPPDKPRVVREDMVNDDGGVYNGPRDFNDFNMTYDTPTGEAVQMFDNTKWVDKKPVKPIPRQFRETRAEGGPGDPPMTFEQFSNYDLPMPPTITNQVDADAYRAGYASAEGIEGFGRAGITMNPNYIKGRKASELANTDPSARNFRETRAYGGESSYQVDDEVDMTEQELRAFIDGGGSVEYV